MPVQKHSEGGDLKVDIPFIWYGKLIKFELDTCELDHMRLIWILYRAGEWKTGEGREGHKFLPCLVLLWSRM